MPYIHVSTTEAISEAKADAVKARLGKAIALLPGKSETYLMVRLDGDSNMYFQGTNDAPVAMCEVSVFGKANRDACNALTAELCTILSEELDVPPARCYVKFVFTDTWGFSGGLF